MARIAWLLGLTLTLVGNAASAGAEAPGERLMSGAAWEDFCRRLEEVGKQIRRVDLPDLPSIAPRATAICSNASRFRSTRSWTGPIPIL